MRLKSLSRIATILSLLIVVTLSGQIQAQTGCARCASPVRQIQNGGSVPWVDVATRYRPDPVRIEETPAASSPFYSPAREDTGTGENRLFVPTRRPAPSLVPTESVAPAATEDSPSDKPRPPVKPAASKATIAEKISLRFADPRVIRMLQQLTPQGAESFYVEVSELIDGRHITPATYARRVDNALDHVAQALEVPSFVEAAQVRGSTAAISDLQGELQKMRTQVKVRSTNDALVVLRSVQRMADQSISINPAAISLEFLYGATDSLDQFSMLLPPERNGGPSVGLRDNVVGIGVEVEPHANGLKILKLLPGGPAAQADLRRGDVITHADGNDLKQLELNRAVDLIVGPVGTPVQIEASRGGKSGRVTLTRQKIALHSVVDVRMEDQSKGVAYLKLEQFADSTMNEIDAALMKLHQQGMESLILDLRGNPGGLLTTAIALSDRFLPAGTIVSTRGRTLSDNSKETAHYANTWKVPLVVLIDHNSASASEIFAAAIQENHRGVIVGEKSYGKGTVQTLFPLQTFPAALRLTTAKFYSPEGREMSGAGVTPDVKVTAESDPIRQEDAVLNEALRQISNPRVKDMANSYRRTGETQDESHVAA